MAHGWGHGGHTGAAWALPSEARLRHCCGGGWGRPRLRVGNADPGTKGERGAGRLRQPRSRGTVCSPIHVHCLALSRQTRSIQDPSLASFQQSARWSCSVCRQECAAGRRNVSQTGVRRSVWTAGHVLTAVRVKAAPCFEPRRPPARRCAAAGGSRAVQPPMENTHTLMSRWLKLPSGGSAGCVYVLCIYLYTCAHAHL